MSQNKTLRDKYNYLPVYSGVLLTFLGFVVGAIGAVYMLYIQFNIGVFIVFVGWLLIWLGMIMDNTGFLLDLSNYNY